MKILITGSSGFLGRKLIEKFSSLGIKAAVICRSQKTASERLGGYQNVELFEGDITNLNSLRIIKKKLKKIDKLIHLAALVPKNNSEDLAALMFKVNVKGTINLLEVFGQAITGLIYASTAEVYGLPETKKSIRESFLENPLSYYAASKLAAENICQVYSKKNGLSVSILRFTTLYGPRDLISRAIPNFIKSALLGKNLEVYGGEDIRDYLHVEDAAEALYLATLKTQTGRFNIGSGKGVKIKDAAKLIIKKINPKLGINLLPPQKKVTKIVLNIEKAKKLLGFYPNFIFPDKLDETIAWFKKQ